MKTRIPKKIYLALILIGFGCILLGLYREAILVGAGNFLTPQGIGRADVVILESTELIREEAVQLSIGLLASGRASRLIVVYQNSDNEKIFGRPHNYDLFLVQELEQMGIKKNQIQVLGVPKKHPITLREAQLVLSNLSKNGVKRAILLADGFHTRRSYWTYREVGSLLGIEIIPHPYFVEYRNENWWQRIYGVGGFFEESFKLLYYILRGYIPIKSLLVT
jgi:hypothetical protein